MWLFGVQKIDECFWFVLGRSHFEVLITTFQLLIGGFHQPKRSIVYMLSCISCWFAVIGHFDPHYSD